MTTHSNTAVSGHHLSQGQNQTDLPALELPTRSQADQTRATWKSILAILGGGLLGAAGGYLAVSLFNFTPPEEIIFSTPEKALLLTGILLMAFAAIFLHEVGHLLGGKLGGFRFALLIVGPLRLSRSGSDLQWSWNRSLGMMGGLAASLPTPGSDIASGLRLMIAGGPAISLIVGIALSAAAWLIVPLTKTAVVAQLLLLVPGLTSLAIAVVTLIPHNSGGFKSDGRRLLELRRRHPEALHTNLVVLVSTAAMTGQRPRDWDPALMAQLAALDSPTAVTAAAASLLYTAALDRGDMAAARRHLQRLLDLNHLLPSAVQNEALFEAAFFEAWVRQDAAQALRFLPQTSHDGLGDPVTRLVAHTAVSLRQNDWQAAQTHLQAAHKALPRTLYPGTAVYTRELLADMAAQLPPTPA